MPVVYVTTRRRAHLADSPRTQAYADALAAGDGPDSMTAIDVAERHRQHIGRWFYDRSYEMHRGLADM